MILDYSSYVEDKQSSGIVNYQTIDTKSPFYKHDGICPFCNKKIDNRAFHSERKDYPEWLEGSFDEYEDVIQCPVCGWWEYSYKNRSDAVLDGIRASDVYYASAIVKQYENTSVDVPINALREQLIKTPDIIYDIDAHKMEDLVRSVFADFYPSCKVYAFGKTRDGGKDGLLIDDNGNHVLLQVKRRTHADATEGVACVRELMGVAVLEDALKGCIFVSTADHFSNDAKKYTDQLLQKKIVESFDLVDCKEFLRRIDVTRQKLPQEWEKLLKIKK